jgi:hypothetical protein
MDIPRGVRTGFKAGLFTALLLVTACGDTKNCKIT